jgi:hypothetical protein
LTALVVVVACLSIVGVAGAQAPRAIAISDLTPADGSAVPVGQPVLLSGFITTDGSIAIVNGKPDVTVLVDGAAVADAQFVVGSRAVRVGFRANRTFAAGGHTLRVTARNVNGEAADAQSTFTASANVTATAAPTIPTVATATPVPAATATVATAVATVAPTATPTAAAPAAVATTSVAGAATIPTTAPVTLPITGDFPLADALPALLAFGWTLTLFGVALRRR